MAKEFLGAAAHLHRELSRLDHFDGCPIGQEVGGEMKRRIEEKFELSRIPDPAFAHKSEKTRAFETLDLRLRV
ncbi:MAG: hypothetical protein Q8M76_00285, partial [Spirochaetaceae bacterium]|nr:hypothetical protein [Spirochaetaceae bacterium]